MADRIKGITIEIGGDTTGLNKALSGVNKEISSTQSALKDVERLLKLDPSNTELLRQKQKLLADAVQETKGKLDTLKEANKQTAESASNYDAWKTKYDPIKKQIDETKKKLADLKAQSKDADEQLANGEISQEKYDAIQEEIKQTSKELRTLQKSAKEVSDEFGNPVSPEQYDALQREIIETEQQLKSLEDQAGKANATLQQISAVGDKFQAAGQKIEGVGKKLLPISVAVGGIGAAAIKTTADFDESMSNVSAISGATGEDFDKLRDKAREMGAETKFSASEAADAMSYMAMAGWKTDDMLNGISGIMDLAAASGADLATTSDIVTDALTGMGYTAADAGRLADVMAAASSNANTNVEMMGETFKYVAPVCGSLGYSMEDTALAVGLMANSGIKASQAGTQLRGAITNMVKPTEAMEGIMNELGIEIANEDGSMKSLDETLKILRDSFAVTTEEQKAQRLATLEQQAVADGYGDSLKGLTEEEKYFQLAMYAGQEQVENMSEAQFKKQAMDKLGIKVTKKTNKAQVAQNLALALGTQSLEGLTQEQQSAYAATLFGKEAMSGMLAIINASEEDYNKLSDAIANSNGAAKSMSETMQDNLNGQLTILKSQLQEAAIAIGDALIPKIRALVSKIQEWTDWFNQLDESQKEMVITIGLVAAALGPMLIAIGKVSTGIGALLHITSSLGGVLGALGIAGGPIMMTVAALGLLGAAYLTVKDDSDKYYKKARELSDEEKDSIERVDALKESYDELAQHRQDSVSSIETQTQYESDLWKELQGIVDENGKVQEGYELRAAFITSELREALGIEIGLNDGIIEGYQNIQGEIDKLIQKKQEEAILSAYEAEYQEALANRKALQEEIITQAGQAKQASEDYNKALENEKRLQSEYNSLMEEYAKNDSTGVTIGQRIELAKLGQELENTRGSVQGYKEHMDQMNTSLQGSQEALDNFNNLVVNWQGASAAIISGDQQEISNSLLILQNDFKTAEASTRESLEAQCETYKTKLAEARAAVKQGTPGITDEYIAELVRLELKSRQELAKVPENAEKSVTDAASAVKGKAGEMESAGCDYVLGLAKGIIDNAKQAADAVVGVADDTVKATRTAWDSHSPSRVAKDIGMDYPAGLAEGIAEGTSQVTEAVTQVAEAATSTLETQLQQSDTTTQTYQTTMSTSWSTWATNLVSTINTSLAGIGLGATTQLGTMKSSFATETDAINAGWAAKWDAIETKHKTTMEGIKALTETVLRAVKTLSRTETQTMKTDTITAMNQLVAGVDAELKNLEPTVKAGFDPAVKHITDLVPMATTWSHDMMDNFIQGIRDKMSELEDACEDVAETVSDYMHFTRPEKGPLRYYEEWMPHMIQGLAKGIRDNRNLITDQMKVLAADMAAIQGVAGSGDKPAINFSNRTILELEGRQIGEVVDEYLGGVYG
ncbi:phage tail tape measure protein [Enterocloster citroniae]|uniref:phage tail tape measure protein n=1 Tax=Enterocloster citroniae TaxID=358743 RepID=UPI0018978CD4|nr:phage tail tape measure protein [Enterocloster citroniae]